MSIKKDFEKLDSLFGSNRWVALSDEQYANLRPLIIEMLQNQYIVEETEMDNARNVYWKTEQYKFFLEDIKKRKHTVNLNNFTVVSKSLLKWILGILSTIITLCIEKILK